MGIAMRADTATNAQPAASPGRWAQFNELYGQRNCIENW